MTNDIQDSDGTATVFSTTVKKERTGGEVIITETNSNDVIMGRGKAISSYPGNINFRRIVWSFKEKYRSTRSGEGKRNIATRVMRLIYKLDPPGRFIEEAKEGEYVEICCDRAIKKICQSLRETSNYPPEAQSRDNKKFFFIQTGSFDVPKPIETKSKHSASKKRKPKAVKKRIEAKFGKPKKSDSHKPGNIDDSHHHEKNDPCVNDRKTKSKENPELETPYCGKKGVVDYDDVVKVNPCHVPKKAPRNFSSKLSRSVESNAEDIQVDETNESYSEHAKATEMEDGTNTSELQESDHVVSTSNEAGSKVIEFRDERDFVFADLSDKEYIMHVWNGIHEEKKALNECRRYRLGGSSQDKEEPSVNFHGLPGGSETLEVEDGFVMTKGLEARLDMAGDSTTGTGIVVNAMEEGEMSEENHSVMLDEINFAETGHEINANVELDSNHRAFTLRPSAGFEVIGKHLVHGGEGFNGWEGDGGSEAHADSSSNVPVVEIEITDPTNFPFYMI